MTTEITVTVAGGLLAALSAPRSAEQAAWVSVATPAPETSTEAHKGASPA